MKIQDNLTETINNETEVSDQLSAHSVLVDEEPDMCEKILSDHEGMSSFYLREPPSENFLNKSDYLQKL